MTTTPASEALAALHLSEATTAAIQAAEERLVALQRTVTQRDWLNITQVLDRTRTEVIQDGGLRLLALAWVKEKAAHGGASWNVLLDMTDEDLLALHGFPTADETPDEDPAGPEGPEASPVALGAASEGPQDPHRP